MTLLRFTKVMILGTILAVVYIHMQMQIIQLAYVGKAKEKRIKKMVEENDNLIHDILVLKSASHLGTEMFTEKSKMKFVGPDNIVKLQAPEDILAYRVAQNSKKEDQDFSNVLSFLSMGGNAEAKTNR
jgi:hypothetical protein